MRRHAASVCGPMTRPMRFSVVPEGRAGPQQATGNSQSPRNASGPQEIPA
jgi:hypothetical protein